MNTKIENNKRAVREFYELAFNQRQPAEAVARYVGGYYRQHNPLVGDGGEPFIAFVTGFAKSFPGLHVDLERLIAEGDLVVVHCHITRNSGDRGLAVMDIFRVENGKIVEHWDVMQEIPESAANTNTMF